VGKAKRATIDIDDQEWWARASAPLPTYVPADACREAITTPRAQHIADQMKQPRLFAEQQNRHREPNTGTR